MDQEAIRAAQRLRDAASRPTPVGDQTIIDQNGRAVPQAQQDWGHHPQMRRPRARKLEPWNDEPGYDPQYDDRRDDRVNVSVTNAGQHYRPWREELLISGWKTTGNFLAWPVRFVKGIIEAIANSIVGLFGFILKILIVPTVLFLGISLYQTSKEKTAAETAQVVGKESVGVIGGLVKGIWDGITGGDEPAPAKTSPAKP